MKADNSKAHTPDIPSPLRTCNRTEGTVQTLRKIEYRHELRNYASPLVCGDVGRDQPAMRSGGEGNEGCVFFP
jgi:hypothetical protein